MKPKLDLPLASSTAGADQVEQGATPTENGVGVVDTPTEDALRSKSMLLLSA